MNKPLIICKNVCFSYDNTVVVENINFSLYTGDYLCIVGENGAGKSTLMKGLLGLKAPSIGEINLSDELGKNEIGYLPQQTQMQRDFPASVFEVVISGTLNKKRGFPFYNKSDKMHALDNMKKLGVEHLKNNCYRELSGGQQQRVLLARALCSAKKVLLLDEPVTGLDPSVSNDMYNIIFDINKKFKITIIMISHDINSACKYANKILHINKNQVFFGSSNDYLKSDAVKTFYNNKND